MKKLTVMAFKIKLLSIFFMSFCANLSMATSKSTPSNITWWCNKTPHPKTCNYFINRHHKHFQTKHLSEFRNKLIKVSMESAVVAEKQVRRCRKNVQNEHQRAAWMDCLKLYGNTILQLNRTLRGLEKTRNKRCTDFDAQTWLSTALTNIKTCQTGFHDLNVSDFIKLNLVTFKNLSELISNSLASNEVLSRVKNESNYSSAEYPSWLTRKQRKLLASPKRKVKANLVVAQDGSGHFKKIQAAIDMSAKRTGRSRFVIHVKRGVYQENIEVGISNDNIVLIGDGMKYTIITSARSVQGGYTTYSSATAGIDGLHFMARDITFSNTAGPLKGQAVALRSASDLSVFYRCAFQGYQDTLLVHAQRQFYKSCYIYGTIDFIFGNAAVVFQTCLIYVRKPLHGQENVITAQGRNDPYQNTGISIHNSQVLAAPDLVPLVLTVETYLGRPWQQYARVVFMKTYFGSLINPLGWSQWVNTNYGLNTVYFGEYGNFGPGSNTRQRVRWRGFHIITNPEEVSKFTAAGLIAGGTWLPSTGIPYTLGL